MEAHMHEASLSPHTVLSLSYVGLSVNTPHVDQSSFICCIIMLAISCGVRMLVFVHAGRGRLADICSVTEPLVKTLSQGKATQLPGNIQGSTASLKEAVIHDTGVHICWFAFCCLPIELLVAFLAFAMCSVPAMFDLAGAI
jgi:hypothetical protein